VYAAFLEDIEGDPLLIQDNVSPLLGNGNAEYVRAGVSLSPIDPVDHKLQHAAKDAAENFERHRTGVMPVDGRFKLDRAYQIIPRTTALLLWNRDRNACKPFGPGATLIALSPVGFNSDQTLAAMEPTVIFSACSELNHISGGWSGSRMFRKQCGKWKPVKNKFGNESAIDG